MSYNNLIFAANFNNMSWFFFGRGLPPEYIENRLEFKWTHWITVYQSAKFTFPSQYTWSPGLKIGVVIFCPCLRAVPQPRTSQASTGFDCAHRKWCFKGIGAASIPLERSRSKKVTIEQFNPSKIGIHSWNSTTENPNIGIRVHPNLPLSASAFPTLPSHLNLQYLPQSQWFYCHSHLAGLCHGHTQYISEKLSSLRII